MKFILLHEGKNDEGIRAFFMDVWELYIKVGVFMDDELVDKQMLTRSVDNAEPISYGIHADKEHGVPCTGAGECEATPVDCRQ